MRRGDFARAWEVSDRVLVTRRGRRSDDLPRHQQWIWNGTSLAGKRVLIRCYHGLGDTIQFIRYIPLLQAIAGEVAVWAQPAVIPLLATVRSRPLLLPLHDGVPEYDYDADIELMELPHYFRTTLETIPADVPYIHAQARDRGRRRDSVTVCVFPKAGDWDGRRTLPDYLLPRLRVPGIQLQIFRRDVAERSAVTGFQVIGGADDLPATAAVMTSADLVISADSMPAHLAGALGVPTWTLLHADPDWRWMTHRTDSPWYPTMRLFRQEEPGNWAPVFDQVRTALMAMAERLAR
jgi:hypothetical protein